VGTRRQTGEGGRTVLTLTPNALRAAAQAALDWPKDCNYDCASTWYSHKEYVEKYNRDSYPKTAEYG